MRFFKNGLEALKEIERDLVEMGIDNHTTSMQNKDVAADDDYSTKELVGYSMRITDARPSNLMESTAEFYGEDYKKVRDYCIQETNDRFTTMRDEDGIRGINPGRAFLERAEVWKPFLNEDGRFDYTYSERITPCIELLQRTIQNDPRTRQAILPIFWPPDLASTGGRRRVPCSMYYQFMYRAPVLHVLYTMRSADLYTHFGYDLTLATMIADRLARTLLQNDEGDPGIRIDLTVFVGSLHAYKKDYKTRGVF